ncbi:thioesterase family protein [Aurantivibrio plasticivorans]
MSSNSQHSLDFYPFKVELPIRYEDLDTQGHVNNVSIAGLYQESRVQCHREIFRDLRKQPWNGPVLSKVLAEMRISYLREVHFPHAVTIGVGISRIGNSSYTMSSAMFQLGSCVGTSDATLVYVSEGKAYPIPTDARSILDQYAITIPLTDVSR